MNYDDRVKFDSKYGKVPEGYDLESFDDDYGIVRFDEDYGIVRFDEDWPHRYYRLINSKGEFVTGECVGIYPTENNCYVYWDEHESGVIDNGEIKRIADGTSSRLYLPFEDLGSDLFMLKNHSIVNKDNQVIAKTIDYTPKYSDGKIFLSRLVKVENGMLFLAIDVVSKTGEIIDSFEPNLKFSINECKGGNCLIYDGNKYYGVNFQNKELIEIDGNYKLRINLHDGEVDDYYTFRNDNGKVNIYNSNFELVKNGIYQCDYICRISDEYYYSFWDDINKERRLMDFNGNIAFNHVKKIKNGVMQIGNDKLYDSNDKKWINLPDGWKILSWNKDLKNNQLLATCYDDSDFAHLTDFDTIDIEIGDKKMMSICERVTFGNKYIGINGYIIPVADLKDMRTSYGYTFEISGEVFERNFATRREMNDYARRMKEAISRLDQEREAELSEATKKINGEYDNKKRELVKCIDFFF